ncbi:hypothetical protein [Streptomyces sp. NBC_00118]|uniref:hypothetical protein n=1 Tax=unclassified Streptomyces TaxID=2593676 RepID=UPI003087A0BE|nr:hypothetical protein OG518_38075 [Streptomyces sp. NBC_01397]
MGKAGGEFADLAPDIGKLAAADLTQVIRAVKRKLKMLQYHRRPSSAGSPTLT